MAPVDVEGMRRWLAIGGSLTRADTERLLDACQLLLEQRAAIARILDELGLSWTGVRRALNELHPGDAWVGSFPTRRMLCQALLLGG